MSNIKNRRHFIQTTALASIGTALYLGSCKSSGDSKTDESHEDTHATDSKFFKLSLAEWSLHKALFAKELTNLDFARVTKHDYGLDGIEYVSAFFDGKVEDKSYLDQLNAQASDNEVEQLLIMVDGEGPLATTDATELTQSIENHYKWVQAANHLGCHSIRVNCFGEGSPEEVAAAGIEGLSRLAEYAKDFNINVIVENHGSYSSNGEWLAAIMKEANMPNLGTLPDFGNFCVRRDSGEQWGGNCIEEYDRYKGVKELMPFAKGLSAKSYDFDENGYETKIDFVRMLEIAKASGYHGYIGIEYEGNTLSENEGIIATRDLILKAAKEMA